MIEVGKDILGQLTRECLEDLVSLKDQVGVYEANPNNANASAILALSTSILTAVSFGVELPETILATIKELNTRFKAILADAKKTDSPPKKADSSNVIVVQPPHQSFTPRKIEVTGPFLDRAGKPMCPLCSNILEQGAFRCFNCGRPVKKEFWETYTPSSSDAGKGSEQAIDASSEVETSCRKCAQKLTESASFCPNCRHPVRR